MHTIKLDIIYPHDIVTNYRSPPRVGIVCPPHWGLIKHIGSLLEGKLKVRFFVLKDKFTHSPTLSLTIPFLSGKHT